MTPEVSAYIAAAAEHHGAMDRLWGLTDHLEAECGRVSAAEE